MDTAIVTGAETPLGLRIVQTLVQQGCRVHGIGNNFSKVTHADPQFKGHAVDLTDLDAVVVLLENILLQEQRLDILIHAIDVTPGTAFDKLPPGNLEAILKIGLLGPVMMTRLALPNLLRFQGQLINVITANKHGHPASAANALIEGGLRGMNQALFDQARDAGLRITNCLLRQNTRLSGARVGDEAIAQAHINLADVTRTIEQLIDPKAVNVPAEIVLHPRLAATGEAALPKTPLPLDPYAAVVLPPKEYCPPEQPKIPTEKRQQIERTIPYTDEEMEDRIAAAIEDFEAHPERYEQSDRPPAKRRQQQEWTPLKQPDPRGPAQAIPPQGRSPHEEPGKQKRRRRRGGRNRNKPANGSAEAKPQETTATPGQEKSQHEQVRPALQSMSTEPPQTEQSLPKSKAPVDKEHTAKPTSGTPVKKAAAKKATKKATKKTVKKAAKKTVKKTATKKAVKKVASKKAVKPPSAATAE